MWSDAAPIPAWVSIAAAFGGGTIVGGYIQHLSAKAVLKANHRRDWSNALRDDIASYLKEIDTLHHRIRDTLNPEALLRASDTGTLQELERQRGETRDQVMFLYRRIQLRLNTSEADAELDESLRALQKFERDMPDPVKVAAVVASARKVLEEGETVHA